MNLWIVYYTATCFNSRVQGMSDKDLRFKTCFKYIRHHLDGTDANRTENEKGDFASQANIYIEIISCYWFDLDLLSKCVEFHARNYVTIAPYDVKQQCTKWTCFYDERSLQHAAFWKQVYRVHKFVSIIARTGTMCLPTKLVETGDEVGFTSETRCSVHLTGRKIQIIYRFFYYYYYYIYYPVHNAYSVTFVIFYPHPLPS